MTTQTPNPLDETQNPLGSRRADLTSNTPRSLEAVDVLRRAWVYAADTNRDVWDFAVEASTLQDCGLTPTDFRWLVAKGYVLHASELTQPGADARSFRAGHGLSFDRRTCFVLTEKGLAFANSVLDPSLSLCSVPTKSGPTIPSAREAVSARDSAMELGQVRPHWDCDSRELWFQGEIVKQFKVPSPNQEIVIMSFEEEQWPTCIDDPLPYRADRDPKQRLHDTIRSLNRNQKNRMLRFKGNGTGQGIIWEPVRRDEAVADETAQVKTAANETAVLGRGLVHGLPAASPQCDAGDSAAFGFEWLLIGRRAYEPDDDGRRGYA